MKAERWKDIDRLLDAAMEVDGAERAAFLDQACTSDPGLRREVESLLAAYDRLGNFIESPALELAAKKLAGETPQSVEPNYMAPGQKIGPYEIVSLLGVGGMGEVYLAQDAKLGRKIALKLLPVQFTKDPERVRRFEREARAASALNHPNIVTLFDIGVADGVHFIATEYVEGQTLRERIARGRMEAPEAIEIGNQIAGALSAARAAGVIHRDVKPENVMLRPDGYVKVLDFGLAKLSEQQAPGSDEQRESITRTDAGTVVGTISYMSPEQALGQEVDHRTDIFSLGVVLYEMVMGTPPFKGDTQAAIFDAILHGTPPPVTAADQQLSMELDRVIRRTLEKDREARYQTAADLRADLKLLQRYLDSGEAIPHRAASPSPRPQVKANAWKGKAFWVVGALVIAAMIAYLLMRPGNGAKNSRGPVITSNVTRLTDQGGEELFPSLSPDGSALVYTRRESNKWDIYWQRVGGRTPLNLTKDSKADDTQPAFSPNGKLIAFRSEREGGGIFLMGATGESVRRLTDFGYNPAWSADGQYLVCGTESIFHPNGRHMISHLYRINVMTGETQQITEEDGVQPQFSPAGSRVAYWRIHKGGQRDLFTVPATGGEPVAVTDDRSVDWNPVWSPDGKYLYFLSDRGGSMNLWRVSIEEASGKVTGQPEAVTTPAASLVHISFSRDGRRIIYVQEVVSVNVMKLNFDPVAEKLIGQPEWFTQGSRLATSPDLSPDGEWLAFGAQGEGQEDLFIIGKDGTGRRALIEDGYRDRVPRWSPDSRQIAFYSDRSGKYEMWVIKPDGSGLRQLTSTASHTVSNPTWSPDGVRLALAMAGGEPFIIETDKTAAEQLPQPFPAMSDAGAYLVPNSWSSDGKRLAGSIRRNSGPFSGIAVYSFETRQYEKLLDYGDSPYWLKDNRRLLFHHQDKLYLLDSRSKKVSEIYSFSPHIHNGFGISRDNRIIYSSIVSTESDIWIGTWE